MNKDLKTSLLNSYFIGLPVGIGFIAATIFLPSMFSGEGLLTMIMLVSFGQAIAGLTISFVFSLWIGAIIAKNSIKNGDKLIITSFKYSGIINLIIWTVFGFIAVLNPDNEFNSLLLPLIACVISTIVTTITIGLLICYCIKDGTKKNTAANNGNRCTTL